MLSLPARQKEEENQDRVRQRAKVFGSFFKKEHTLFLSVTE
jgi:hypothetical protein